MPQRTALHVTHLLSIHVESRAFSRCVRDWKPPHQLHIALQVRFCFRNIQNENPEHLVHFSLLVHHKT